MPENQPQQVIVNQTPSNGLGTAGFVLSLVGFLTCGLLCPLGFILSLCGLGGRPKGLAIAGTILGIVGSMWLVLGGFAMAMACVGLAAVADSATKAMTTTENMRIAESRVQAEVRQRAGASPSPAEGNAIVSDLTDGWGSRLRYDVIDAGRFRLTSPGPDGELGTGDDVSIECDAAPR